ncbi:MAG: hypothetical protein PHE24_01120 [Patescibacteria group bacterium]|nr:hypothetical protein [Patescibacteria group bacterium]
MDEATLKLKARGIMMVDMSDFAYFDEAHPIMRELSPHVGGFCVNLAASLSSYYAILLAAKDLKTRIFLNLNINVPDDEMGNLGKKLKDSGAAMVSIHCSAGFKAIENFVDEMNKGTRPFREAWEIQPEESSSSLPFRPLIFAITIPINLEPCAAAPIFGEFYGRMKSFQDIVSRRELDGVICSPRDIKSYDDKIAFGHIKKMIYGVDPKGSSNCLGKTITPTAAINSNADYLVIKDPIINYPPGSSMIKEAEKIFMEIYLALGKKYGIETASAESPKRRKAPTETICHPINDIIKLPPAPEKSKNTKQKKKKSSFFSL